MRLIALLCLLTVTACGYKGRLRLPEEPASKSAEVEEQEMQSSAIVTPNTPLPTYQPRDPYRNWRKPDPLQQIQMLHRRR